MRIRGYRVEPAEVESHAAGRTGVRDRVADPRDPLPGHLVPDPVRHLDELPHNANGKVDHRAVTELPRVPTPGRG